MPYCVDTSGWLDGWQRHYPPDVFPSLWGKLESLVNSGEILSSEEVYLELKKKSDELHHWIQARKQMLVPLDEPIQFESRGSACGISKTSRYASWAVEADPFVIATAMERG